MQFSTIFSLGFLCNLATCGTLAAEQNLCGTAPQIPTTTQVEDSIKGELDGKAQFLTRFVGKAELGGKIESARKELYQNTDKFFAAQNDAYLAYMFCVIVMKDNSLTTSEKLKALQEFKKPVSSSALEKTPPLQTRDGQILLVKGPQGEQKSDAYVEIKLIAAPVQPSTLLVDIVDRLGNDWVIVGADYRDDGLLRIYLRKGKSSSDTLKLLIRPDGFQRQWLDVTIGASSPAELHLVRNSPFAIDRITKLDDVGALKDDLLSLTLDIIISNRTSEDLYISKFIILFIGSSNSGCNPNPIATFKYDLKLTILGEKIEGQVSAPGEKKGLPVFGDYVHSYCDGYLMASYSQSVPVVRQSKISYVLSIGKMDLKATEIEAPEHSMMEFHCKLEEELAKFEEERAKKGKLSDKKGARKLTDSCKNRPSAGDQKIDFLGYTANELRELKSKGKLDRSMNPSMFMRAGDRISYVAPHLQNCLLLALTEDGLVAFSSFCFKESHGDSDYSDEIIAKLVAQGVRDVDASQIVKASYKGKTR